MSVKKRGGIHPVDVFVGKRLRVLRQSRNLSQEKMAFRVGLTFQQIQKYEKGLNRISCSKLYEFSKLLNVRVQDFFDGFIWSPEDNSLGDSLADSSQNTGYVAGVNSVPYDLQDESIAGVSERELEKIVSAVITSEEEQIKDKVTKVLRVLGRLGKKEEGESILNRYNKDAACEFTPKSSQNSTDKGEMSAKQREDEKEEESVSSYSPEAEKSK